MEEATEAYRWEIKFGARLKCRLKLEKGVLTVEDAVDGWGDNFNGAKVTQVNAQWAATQPQQKEVEREEGLQWVKGYERMPIDIKKVKIRTLPNEDEPYGVMVNPEHILGVDDKGIKVNIPVKDGTLIHIAFYGFEWLSEPNPTPEAGDTKTDK